MPQCPQQLGGDWRWGLLHPVGPQSASCGTPSVCLVGHEPAKRARLKVKCTKDLKPMLCNHHLSHLRVSALDKFTLDLLRPHNNNERSGVKGLTPSFILLMAGAASESCPPQASLHAARWSLPPGLPLPRRALGRALHRATPTATAHCQQACQPGPESTVRGASRSGSGGHPGYGDFHLPSDLCGTPEHPRHHRERRTCIKRSFLIPSHLQPLATTNLPPVILHLPTLGISHKRTQVT